MLFLKFVELHRIFSVDLKEMFSLLRFSLIQIASETIWMWCSNIHLFLNLLCDIHVAR